MKKLNQRSGDEPSPSITHWTRLGFTGHRHLVNPIEVSAQLNTTLQQLQSEYGAIVTISSVASGADTLFLEAAEALSLPSKLILPFSKDRFKNDFSASDWQRAEQQLARAIECSVVEPCESATAAYWEAGVQTVEDCDLLLAVWDGQIASGIGGTAEVVSYAQALGKQVIVIDAQRSSVNNPLIVQTAQAEQTTEQLATEQSAETPAVSTNSTPPSALLLNVQACYQHHDHLAMKTSPWARRLANHIIFLHLFASALAIIGSVTHPPHWLGKAIDICKVAALIVAWVLGILHHRPHHSWTDARPAAELCRFFIGIWRLRRQALPLNSIVPASLQHLSIDLMTAWQMDASAALTFTEAKEEYLQQRIEKQLLYFKQQLQPSRWIKTWTHTSAHLLTLLAILGGIIALMWPEKDVYYTLAKLASIILPLGVAALLAVAISQDAQRRLLRYQALIQRLHAAKIAIETAPTWLSLWRAVIQVETELLHEVAEWHAITQFSQSH